MTSRTDTIKCPGFYTPLPRMFLEEPDVNSVDSSPVMHEESLRKRSLCLKISWISPKGGLKVGYG